jgi:chromate reductase
MSEALSLVGIIGSLRRESFNRAVFDAAVELVADGVTLTEVPIGDVPLYNGDVEEAGVPDAVTRMREAVEAADGLIFFTPEYNFSVPAVTKNALDWLSRVPGDSTLSRSVTAAVAASPGGHGAAGVQEHIAVSLGITSKHFHVETHGIGGVAAKIEDGRLVDTETRDALAAWLDGFVAAVRTAGEPDS